jgi:hypothetical protein
LFNKAPPLSYSQKEDTIVPVYTNFFPIKFKKNVDKMEVYQYHVQIINVKREYVKDANGESVLDDRNRKKFQLVPVEGTDMYRDRKSGDVKTDESSNMTRAILLQCQNDLLVNDNKVIVSTNGFTLV